MTHSRPLLEPRLFISYRRINSQPYALLLRHSLEARFGCGRVFLDVADIVPGEPWPERLRRELYESSILLLIVGPDWATVAGEFGGRRIDDPNDWVRLEIAETLARNKPIIPLLVGRDPIRPTQESLPDEIAGLADCQSFALRDEAWEADCNRLSSFLVSRYGFSPVCDNLRSAELQVHSAQRTAAKSNPSPCHIPEDLLRRVVIIKRLSRLSDEQFARIRTALNDRCVGEITPTACVVRQVSDLITWADGVNGIGITAVWAIATEFYPELGDSE